MAVELYPIKKVTRPHTEIITDTSGIGGSSSGSVKVLMLIGSAQGGKPNTVYRVRNYMQAKQVFRSGELLDAIELAWNPSTNSGLNNAGDILAMRVEDAENATLKVDGLEVSSEIYGLDANDIQLSLEDNTMTKTKRLTVSFSKDRYHQTFDNLGKIFSVEYKGTEAEATISVEVDPLTGKARTLTLKAGTGIADKAVKALGEGEVGKDFKVAGAGTVAFEKSYDLGQGIYEDTNVLISDINNLPDFRAKFFPIGDKNVPTETYETLVDADIKNKADVFVNALAGDIQKQTAYNGYVTFKFDSEKEITNFPLTKLTGGTNGTVPESWASKFKKFAYEGGYYIVPLTSKQAVHAEVTAFVQERTLNGEPMRAFVGGGVNESTEELMSRALNIRNERVALVGESGSRRMDDGRVLRLSGYMFGAQVAGLASGLEVAEPITLKPIAVDALDTILDSSQLDQLNESGVINVEFVRNSEATGFRIVQGITTYNDKNAPVKNEISVGEGHDFLVSSLKYKLDNTFIGTKSVELTPSLIKNFIQSFLDDKKRSREITNYEPAEVQVVIEGDVVFISFTVVPVRGINKIEVKMTYKQQILTA